MTSTTADRYRTLAQAFADKVAAVQPGQWTNTTPCDQWTARDLVRHVVEAQGMFPGFIGREIGELPSVDEDPSAAFAGIRSAIQADLDDSAVADTSFDGFFGPTTFAEAVDRFVCFDLVVHGWDLARATGQDERIPPEEIERVYASAQLFGDALHRDGVCGPEVPVAGEASEQDRLLGLLGRQP